MLNDLRYALRMLLKCPGFTAVAVVTLAIGIGANTAVFTFINAILMRALPVSKPHELVRIEASSNRHFISFPVYRDLLVRQQAFMDVLATAGETPLRLTIPSSGATPVEIDNVRVNRVTANYFDVLGVRPAMGRSFVAEDDRVPQSSESAGSVAIISDAFWERQFARDPDVLGKTVIVTRSPCTIIGVAPRGFFGEMVGGATDVWVPLVPFSSREHVESREGVFTMYIGRLRPRVSTQQAQRQLTSLFQQLLAEEKGAPATAPGVASQADPLQNAAIVLQPAATGLDFGLRRTLATPLWIIMAIVILVLLIACANIANLLLSRAVTRRRELSVRLSLGCTRARLIRQLLTESLVLAALGAAGGLILALWGRSLLLGLMNVGPMPQRIDVSLDLRVLLFTTGLMFLAAIGFGLLPAWRATRLELASAMKDQDGVAGRQFLGRVLVVVQVATSLLLLVAGSLLVRSLYNLKQIDLGFRPQQVLMFDLAHDPSNGDPAALARVARATVDRVSRIPGVQSASASGFMLFGRADVYAQLRIQDYTPAPGENMSIRFNSVSPGYFQTIGMALVAGRGIEDRDSENAPRVAVINETMARRYFRNANPIGRMMALSAGPPPHQPIEIVGVVRDAKYNSVRADVKPMFYMSLQQLTRNLRSVEVRTVDSASAVAGPVRDALSGVTKDIMVRRVVTLSDQVNQSLAGERLITGLCAFFGTVAQLLASIGLFGVLSYAVERRTREIGIRMALGARRTHVMWLVLRQSLAIVLIGVGLGLLLAFFSTRLLVSFLYGLSPSDPAMLSGSVSLLVFIAVAASYLPARRAARVDPMVALRSE